MRAAAADLDAPTCKVTKVKKTYTSKAFRKGITARATCDETATVTMQILVGLKGGRFITSNAGDFVLAEKTEKIGPTAKSTRLKPRKKLAVKLPKRVKGRVKIQAVQEGQEGQGQAEAEGLDRPLAAMARGRLRAAPRRSAQAVIGTGCRRRTSYRVVRSAAGRPAA